MSFVLSFVEVSSWSTALFDKVQDEDQDEVQEDSDFRGSGFRFQWGSFVMSFVLSFVEVFRWSTALFDKVQDEDQDEVQEDSDADT